MSFPSFLRHLRLHFQLVLAPVFLLGYALSGARADASLVLLFLLLHVGLYGGATAYNSYWDRDQGPVGGMKHPPGVGQWELWGGLGLQIIAVGLMIFWGWKMALAGLAMLGMGIAYSHPRWRWKGRPWRSLLTVTVGQGLLPFFMGTWAGGQQQSAATGWEIGLAAASAALVITGLYPLTQVYQIEEDGKRGDCSFAVRYGPGRVFALARWGVGTGVGLLLCAAWLGDLLGDFWIWLGLPGYGAFWWTLGKWEERFARQDAYQNHDWAFGLSAGLSGAFWVLALVEMAR
jgi:1,4-dihydroxy-2-naphthoate octaprenyltransferase